MGGLSLKRRARRRRAITGGEKTDISGPNSFSFQVKHHRGLYSLNSLRDTIPLLLPFLHKSAHDNGFRLSPGFLEPTDVYACLRLIPWIKKHCSDLGQIRLHTVPGDGVQVHFPSEPILGPKDVDLDNKGLRRFCQDLFAGLIRSGFILPPPEESAHTFQERKRVLDLSSGPSPLLSSTL